MGAILTRRLNNIAKFEWKFVVWLFDLKFYDTIRKSLFLKVKFFPLHEKEEKEEYEHVDRIKKRVNLEYITSH